MIFLFLCVISLKIGILSSPETCMSALDLMLAGRGTAHIHVYACFHVYVKNYKYISPCIFYSITLSVYLYVDFIDMYLTHTCHSLNIYAYNLYLSIHIYINALKCTSFTRTSQLSASCSLAEALQILHDNQVHRYTE